MSAISRSEALKLRSVSRPSVAWKVVRQSRMATIAQLLCSCFICCRLLVSAGQYRAHTDLCTAEREHLKRQRRHLQGLAGQTRSLTEHLQAALLQELSGSHCVSASLLSLLHVSRQQAGSAAIT